MPFDFEVAATVLNLVSMLMNVKKKFFSGFLYYLLVSASCVCTGRGSKDMRWWDVIRLFVITVGDVPWLITTSSKKTWSSFLSFLLAVKVSETKQEVCTVPVTTKNRYPNISTIVLWFANHFLTFLLIHWYARISFNSVCLVTINLNSVCVNLLLFVYNHWTLSELTLVYVLIINNLNNILKLSDATAIWSLY